MKKVILLFALITALLSGCKKDDDSPKMELQTTNVVIHSGEEVMLDVTPKSTGCAFVSQNPLIASVSTTGEIKGITVGETYITVSNKTEYFSAQCKVVVEPKYSMYREPCLDFGASPSTIKSYETRTSLSETTKAINYKGENSNIAQLAYSFENSRYIGVVCLIPSAKLSLLTDFILERYVPVAVGDGDILAAFVSVDKKTTVGIFYYSTSYVGSIYMPYTDGKSKATDWSNELIKYKEMVDAFLLHK